MMAYPIAEHGLHEFAQPCGVPRCPNTATWMGWVAHSTKGCPNTAYSCDTCKEYVDKWWRGTLKEDGVMCLKCGAEISGHTTSEVLRWMKL